MEPKIMEKLLNGLVSHSEVRRGDRVAAGMEAKMVELQRSCTASGYGDEFCADGLNHAAKAWFSEKTANIGLLHAVHQFMTLRFGGVKK